MALKVKVTNCRKRQGIPKFDRRSGSDRGSGMQWIEFEELYCFVMLCESQGVAENVGCLRCSRNVSNVDICLIDGADKMMPNIDVLG